MAHQAAERQSKHCLHISVYGDVVVLADTANVTSGEYGLYRSHCHTVRDGRIGIGGYFPTAEQRLVILFRLTVSLTLQHVLLIEGIVEGGGTFALQFLAVIGGEDVAHEYVDGQSVEHRVMGIQEQVDCLGSLHHIDAHKVIGEQVEGMYFLLEIFLCRFFVHMGYGDMIVYGIPALHHHLAVHHGEVCLEDGVCSYSLLCRKGKQGDILVSEAVNHGDVVLCGVAVNLPVEVQAVYILCEGIEVALFILQRNALTTLCFHDTFCNAAHGSMCEDILDGYLYAKLLGYPGSQSHGCDGGDTQVQKVGGDTKLVGVQQFRHHVEDTLLQFGLRNHHLLCLHLRLGQGTCVYLAVGCQRHLVKLHIGCGHHVVGEFLGEVVAQGIAVNLPVGGIVGAEMLHATYLPYHHALHAYPLVLTHKRLYLAQFDAEAAQLHLTVDTAEVFYLSLGIVAHEVTGVVHLHRLAVDVDVAETFGRQFLTVPVASGYLHTAHTEFSGNALRQEMSLCVHNDTQLVVQGSADGDVAVLLARLHIKEGGDDGKLRRAVGIDETALARWCDRHLLTAHHHVFHGQVGVKLQKHLSQLCGKDGTGDAVLNDELVEQGEVLACLLRHGIERAAHGKHGVERLH